MAGKAVWSHISCDFPYRCVDFDYELLYPIYFTFTTDRHLPLTFRSLLEIFTRRSAFNSSYGSCQLWHGYTIVVSISMLFQRFYRNRWSSNSLHGANRWCHICLLIRPRPQFGTWFFIIWRKVCAVKVAVSRWSGKLCWKICQILRQCVNYNVWSWVSLFHNSSTSNKNLAEGITTPTCSATKFTVPIFAVFDVWVYNTCI